MLIVKITIMILKIIIIKKIIILSIIIINIINIITNFINKYLKSYEHKFYRLKLNKIEIIFFLKS